MFDKDATPPRFGRPPYHVPMPTIRLFEDEQCSVLHPFHLVDGASGIRYGAWTQQDRWCQIADDLRRMGLDDADVFDINARWIPDEGVAKALAGMSHGSEWRVGDVLIAEAQRSTPIGEGTGQTEAQPRLICHANQLFTELESQLAKDVPSLRETWSLTPMPATPHTAVYGPADQVLIASDARIRAASVDTEAGPVVIGPGVTIEPGVHLKGPLVICEGATVRMGACISGPTVIGPHCKVGGEISNVSFQGWANKAHAGFLGNSVIGRWCNLGAGTESSNLKNTYGEVRQWDAGSGTLKGSGLQFCGLLMGDHSKCGIGTTFNTGTVIDPACVIFDAGFPPKHLPAFSWYNAHSGDMEIQNLDRMLGTAEKVMARRGMEISEAQRAKLTRLHLKRSDTGA